MMDRMQKAREIEFQKKLATERGTPSQIKVRLTEGEPPMAFGKNTDKFKSGFGKDGSAIITNRNIDKFA